MRVGWRVAWLGLLACGGRTITNGGDSDSAGDVSSGGDEPVDSSTTIESDSDGSSGASSGTEDEPVTPECEHALLCGDGVVVPGEACDDGNADDADGCTADCRRPAVDGFATLDFGPSWLGAVDGDGSVIVVGDWPAALARFSADGQQEWRVVLDSDVQRVDSILVGPEIVLVGESSESEDVGAIWRFSSDGTPAGVESDAAGRYYVAATFAPDGGLVVLADDTVERRAPDGTLVWSRNANALAQFYLRALTFTSDEVAFLAGGGYESAGAVIVRVSADGADNTVLAPPEFPEASFDAIASTPDGGAVAVGSASGFAVIAMVDGAGTVVWTSTCSSDGQGTGASGVAVVDQRIVVSGTRSKPEPGCTDVCSGAFYTWLQQFTVDGTVIATDAPEALRVGERYPAEEILGLGRDPSGAIRALVGGTLNQAPMLARFAW